MADVSTKCIYLRSIELKNFRCFSHLVLPIESPYVLLEGKNGVGKTSILESLYYVGYLRSFRTYSPKELVAFKANGFFAKIGLHASDGFFHDIQVGFSAGKKVVRVDNSPISSYKDLMAYYRVISLTEDDLSLIQGSPQCRRQFLDQMMVLLRPDSGKSLKLHRHIVDQRNALLYRKTYDTMTFEILSKQLWEHSLSISNQRKELLSSLENQVGLLQKRFLTLSAPFRFDYEPKESYGISWDEFYGNNGPLFEREKRFGRSLFGAHLDDFLVRMGNNEARFFASRGQQKLVLILIKMAQLQLLDHAGSQTIFLLDDFMTDFDQNNAQELLLALFSGACQLIFTAPFSGSLLEQTLIKEGGQRINLDNMKR